MRAGPTSPASRRWPSPTRPKGRLPPRIINPEAVPRFAARWEAAFGRPMARGARGMIDLVISGDRVVTPHDIGPADVAIGGGKVVAVAARGGFPVPAGARVVDATGKIVMPGGIDPHTHCLWPIPGPDGAVSLTQGPSVVGRAALHGGTTTIIDFTRWTHGRSVQEAIEARMAQWREDGCACDWALHTMVEGDLPPEVPAQLGEAIEAGHPTVKIFTTDITPEPHAAAWSISATSGRCSRSLARSTAASASSTPRTTTSSCTCTPSCSAKAASASRTWRRCTTPSRRTSPSAA